MSDLNDTIAIVESVRDGSTVRARLLMPDGEHQLVNVSLAGVKSPRISSRPEETSEQWAEEVRIYIYCGAGRSTHSLPGSLLH